MERLFLIYDTKEDASGKVTKCVIRGYVTSKMYPSDIAKEHRVIELSKDCHINLV